MKPLYFIFVNLSLAVFTSACSVGPSSVVTQDIRDPYEQRNRRVHEFNRQIDTKFFKNEEETEKQPSAVGDGLRDNVSNLADTASLPGVVVNQVLQGKLGPATTNSVRFVINATLGFGGLADVAGDMGIQEYDTDFGETLHVWGVGEGAYLELPLLGPSTERDAAGQVVDFFTNPLSYVLEPSARLALTGVKVADKAFERDKYGDTVDSVLYDSADSYTQLKLIYVQSRRFELGVEPEIADDDPFALDTSGF